MVVFRIAERVRFKAPMRREMMKMGTTGDKAREQKKSRCD